LSLAWEKSETLNTQPQKRAGKVAQVVECLPRKCETLNSDLSTAKKEKICREQNQNQKSKIKVFTGVVPSEGVSKAYSWRCWLEIN
jgi:hypothetical protein